MRVGISQPLSQIYNNYLLYYNIIVTSNIYVAKIKKGRGPPQFYICNSTDNQNIVKSKTVNHITKLGAQKRQKRPSPPQFHIPTKLIINTLIRVTSTDCNFKTGESKSEKQETIERQSNDLDGNSPLPRSPFCAIAKGAEGDVLIMIQSIALKTNTSTSPQTSC